LNVLLLFFDTLSRAHFIRRLPESSKLLENLHNSNEASLFQFFRTHSFAGTTTKNLRAMFTGIQSSNQRPTIIELYANSGYVTTGLDNLCDDWSVHYNGRTSFMDHQFVAPFCLPEAFPFFCTLWNMEWTLFY